MDPLREEQDYLDVAQDDEHEPAERDAGVHEAQQTVPLPQLHVEETVAKDVPDVLEDGFGGDEGKQEPTPVLPGKLEQDADDAERAVAEHEEHAHQEREHERMEAGCETFNHKSWPA